MVLMLHLHHLNVFRFTHWSQVFQIIVHGYVYSLFCFLCQWFFFIVPKKKRVKGDPLLSFCDDIENGTNEDDFEKHIWFFLPICGLTIFFCFLYHIYVYSSSRSVLSSMWCIHLCILHWLFSLLYSPLAAKMYFC